MAARIAKYPIIYVEWEDSEHDGTWSDLADEEKHQLGLCYSIGWLIHENEKRLVLASSVSQTEVGNKQYIPVKIITKRVVLRGGDNGVRRKRAARKPEGENIRGGADAGDQRPQSSGISSGGDDVKK